MHGCAASVRVEQLQIRQNFSLTAEGAEAEQIGQALLGLVQIVVVRPPRSETDLQAVVAYMQSLTEP